MRHVYVTNMYLSYVVYHTERDTSSSRKGGGGGGGEEREGRWSQGEWRG